MVAFLFPRLATKPALNRFTKLRIAVNDAAEDLGLPIELEIDTHKRTPPAERVCWFVRIDRTEAAAERMSRESIADQNAAEYVPARVVPQTGHGLATRQREIRFFVSYAHDDERHAYRLLELLREQFAASTRYKFAPWADWDILIGERWRERIDKALEDCHVGLLLVSPAFLGSKFIQRHELPELIRSETPLLPVGLVRTSFELHNFYGLEDHQLFRLKHKPGADLQCFEDCGGRRPRRFSEALHNAVEKRLNSVFPVGPQPQRPAPGSDPEDGDDFDRDELQGHRLPPKDIKDGKDVRDFARSTAAVEVDNFVHTRGASFDLREMAQRDLNVTAADRGVNAVEFLEQWTLDDPGRPFCALLGEYGIGKTTTLKELTRRLIERRADRPDTPLPIFIDLRLHYAKRDKGEVPKLEEILTGVIERHWKGGGHAKLTPDSLMRMVQEQGP